jgi:DNA-binding NarL/FixJ family response regulator
VNKTIIKVLIADDDDGVREALSALIADDDGLELVGAVGDAEAAVEVARREHPHVAVLDVVMPHGGGVHAARELGRVCPETRVIGLSTFGDSSTTGAMLDAGAVRYLVKGDPESDVVDTIWDVVAEAGW